MNQAKTLFQIEENAWVQKKVFEEATLRMEENIEDMKKIDFEDIKKDFSWQISIFNWKYFKKFEKKQTEFFQQIEGIKTRQLKTFENHKRSAF